MIDLHFEELWELCENYHKSISSNSISSLIDELIIKISLYKTLLGRLDSIEDKEKIKLRLFGEILFTLSNISLNDNINVFSALAEALNTKNGIASKCF